MDGGAKQFVGGPGTACHRNWTSPLHIPQFLSTISDTCPARSVNPRAHKKQSAAEVINDPHLSTSCKHSTVRSMREGMEIASWLWLPLLRFRRGRAMGSTGGGTRACARRITDTRFTVHQTSYVLRLDLETERHRGREEFGCFYTFEFADQRSSCARRQWPDLCDCAQAKPSTRIEDGTAPPTCARAVSNVAAPRSHSGPRQWSLG